MEEKKLITGGEFLVKETSPDDVFIPEELDEEQRMIGETCKEARAARGHFRGRPERSIFPTGAMKVRKTS